jgi:flagellar biosynthesis/type III secretory pathway chaperone
LAVSKPEGQKLNGEKKNLRKLNELLVRKQYQIETKNTFASLENRSDGEDINGTWKNVKEIIKTSAKESLGLHEF